MKKFNQYVQDVSILEKTIIEDIKEKVIELIKKDLTKAVCLDLAVSENVVIVCLMIEDERLYFGKTDIDTGNIESFPVVGILSVYNLLEIIKQIERNEFTILNFESQPDNIIMLEEIL